MTLSGKDFFASLALVTAAASTVFAGVKINPGNMSPYSKTHVSVNLYSPTDPNASGGIRGVLAEAPSEVLGVLAMPQRFPNLISMEDVEGGSSAKNARNVNMDMTNQVYLASLGSDNAFSFSGLPPAKYDLFVLCDNCFYEGLTLNREENTLTETDTQSIKEKIVKSNPFFNLKYQHRIDGQTGSFGKARVIEQEVRTLAVTLQSAEVMKNIQIRSIKLCLMESVGAKSLGVHWDMKKSREITRQEVGPPDVKGVLPGYFCKALQGIRVSTSVKDLGAVKLTADPAPNTSPAEPKKTH